MRRYSVRGDKGKSEHEERIFVGIDVHRLQWHLSVRTDDVELFNGSIPARHGMLCRKYSVGTTDTRNRQCMKRDILDSGCTITWSKRGSIVW